MKGTASQPHHTCRRETVKRSAQAGDTCEGQGDAKKREAALEQREGAGLPGGCVVHPEQGQQQVAEHERLRKRGPEFLRHRARRTVHGLGEQQQTTKAYSA